MSTVQTDPLIGRLIDGRYQVRSRVARGGMATVYQATDLRLDRRVALKVMHGHLADDSQYKTRFIQEARSAARLAHPNVVNVFDQGQDGEIAYLVMEYLPGITLRELLKDHPVLTNDQALDIMEAILSGLAAAHRNGIVHRDLKPENVLLADDGRIKIGDFGLARAVTAQTATGNALLGTIAYLSPELVTRGIADARSDIYAAGIMLYEMLAGEQPYKGEQPFQIAQQHANDTVPTPSSLNPRVPVELDELVLWATARDPDQRPRDARAMLEQLLDVRELVAAGTTTQAISTQSISAQHTRVLPEELPAAGSEEETQVLGARGRQRATGPQPVDSTIALARASERRKSRGMWALILVLLLAASAGGIGWYYGSGPGSKVVIPSVVGLSVESATVELTNADLVVSDATTEVFSVDIPVGNVVETNPESGTAVAHGETVTLLVSKGAEPLPVPALAGETEEVAKQLIAEARFAVGESTFEFSSETDAGIVLRALGTVDGEPLALAAGDLYHEAQPISLVVSAGPLPSVNDLTVEAALATLDDVGLTGSTSEGRDDWSDTVEKGKVLRLLLPDGPVSPGDTLQLVVSKGVEQVAVPRVEGMTWAEAKPILDAAGFEIVFRDSLSQTLSGFPNDAIVRDINPDPDTLLDKGSTVNVRLRT
ncbi:MAG: Stk1 family PASTA domain-containing Ser/Thr kinase [Cryobacterium sp.]|nr:Stk1 family PASTA domain-containing Ser/Thr kinase [Cryobacterium sp.]